MTENGEVVKTELETAETLNNFYGNVIKNLMTPKYSEYDPSIDRVENRTIRAILKYRNHPSILAIHERKKAHEDIALLGDGRLFLNGKFIMIFLVIFHYLCPQCNTFQNQNSFMDCACNL